MEPIVVPAPPKSAFNKNRRVSDLLMGQLRHFQHVEQKQGIRIGPALGRDIHTEGGAARYIAAITRAIRSQGKPEGIAAVPALVPRPAALPPPEAAGGLALAAAAEAAEPAKKVAGKGGKKGKKGDKKKASKGKNA